MPVVASLRLNLMGVWPTAVKLCLKLIMKLKSGREGGMEEIPPPLQYETLHSENCL